MRKLYIVTTVIILQLTSALSATEVSKCCENEQNLLVDHKCGVNSLGKIPKLKLTCEEKYILDPANVEEDAYNITQNGTLYVPDMDSYLFPNE